MPIEIRELEILAAPQVEANGGSDGRNGGDAQPPGPGALQVERSLLAWHRDMVRRTDRLRAD